MADNPDFNPLDSKVAAFTRRLWHGRSGKSVLMGTLMEKLGIDFQQIGDQGLADELALRARICSRCPNHDECRERLRQGSVPEFRDICSNAAFLEEIGGLKDKSTVG